MKRLMIALFAVALATTAYADGAATYKQKCAACHGQNGEGAKMAPNPIAGTSKDAVTKVIKEGKGKMKAVNIDNADEVATYVAGLKK